MPGVNGLDLPGCGQGWRSKSCVGVWEGPAEKIGGGMGNGSLQPFWVCGVKGLNFKCNF